MRDYLLFYVNGKEHKVRGEQVFQPLSSYLRNNAGATGTKVVCEEGDCGACSVLLGTVQSSDELSYRTVNSCIQYLYQVDGLHVITIEGLKQDDRLNPVQEAMVRCHGTQCGYCTPGFVVAMCEFYDRKHQAQVTAQEIQDSLTGNLCRCTGYLPIIEAGLDVSRENSKSLRELYPPSSLRDALVGANRDEVEILAEEKTVYIPTTLQQAIEFKATHAGTVIISGGTDVCVNMNKREYEPKVTMSLGRLQNLSEITVENNQLVVGGTATLSKVEEFARDNLPELHHLLWLFGSPQIRNAGTMAGNIANASPIADTPPLLFVMDAQLELTGSSGTRLVKITEFYRGYKQFDLRQDEIITRIFLPLPAKDEIVKLYKVSKRKHLDISSFTAAFRVALEGDTIKRIAICYGGVAPVVLRLFKTEEFLKGKLWSGETFELAANSAIAEIAPISDVRGSKEFRNQLARNILLKFFHEVQESRREPACLS